MTSILDSIDVDVSVTTAYNQWTHQLDDAERAHLHDLARTANTGSRPRRLPAPRLRPNVQLLLDGMIGVPAYVRTGSFDILGLNQLGAALLPGLRTDSGATPNLARYLLLDPTRSSSTQSGNSSPAIVAPRCASRPDATPMTATSAILWASSPRVAKPSVSGGRPTTCACTTTPRRPFGTPRWVR